MPAFKVLLVAMKAQQGWKRIPPEQRRALPAEALPARFVRELAQEALATRAPLSALDAELAATLARLRHVSRARALESFLGQ